MRYSLGSLLWIVIALAVPLGLSATWRGDLVLLACISTALIMLVVTRRKLFGMILLMYAATLVLTCLYVIHDVGVHGPYVQLYNERLEKLALHASLVGSPEERVEQILGPATEIWARHPTSTYIDTGEPTPDARYVTTYNYSPYPSFPAAKFQVHCEHGVVQSIELYDD